MLTLLNLSTVGACFAFAALLNRIRHGDRHGIQLMALVFLTMLSTMLGQLFSDLSLAFGVLAIVSAVSYAVPALFNVRSILDWRPRHKRDE